jgi:trehalose 6-phosphate phosphatase
VSRRGVFLDFDGTLSEIVARPDLARPVEGTEEVLARLSERMEVVAVISGRPASRLRELIDVPGVTIVGMYGLAESQGRERILAAVADVERAAALVPGAWVEDKGPSLAVHYRAASDPSEAESVLAPAVDEVAKRFGLSLLRGKMVVEVAAGPAPGKGAVIERVCAESRLEGCLFAGDDLPDLDAFEALDRLSSAGVATVKVAVRTEETPADLLAAADVAVERPAGLLKLLSRL